MRNKAELKFTEEWLRAVLAAFVTLPEDAELIDIRKDQNSRSYLVVISSEEFPATPEGAPYRRLVVSGNHALLMSDQIAESCFETGFCSNG